MSNTNQHPEESAPQPPPPPQVHPASPLFPVPSLPAAGSGTFEYVQAFDKPLTKEEKVAWIVEITYRAVQGELPQNVYPTLREKIESLPEIEPSRDRPEQKLPSSDQLGRAVRQPFYPDAEPLHAYETEQISRQHEAGSVAFIAGFLLFVVFLGGIAYAVGYWTMKNTKVRNPQGTPVAYSESQEQEAVRKAFAPPVGNENLDVSGTVSEQPAENVQAVSKPFRLHVELENPFDDNSLTENPFLGNF